MRCAHLTVEEEVDGRRWRYCLVCGIGYDRTTVLEQLREDVQRRKWLPPLPSSPWTSAERAADPW